MSEERTQNIVLDLIDADEHQIRKAIRREPLQGLSKSMKHGLLQPIVCYRNGDRFKVLDGHRRLAAARLLGWNTIPAIIHEWALSEANKSLLQLIANAQREDVGPMDEARTVQKIMEESHWSGTQVAAELGFSDSRITKDLSLLKLNSEIQTWIEAGKVPASAGYELSKIEDPALQSQLALKIANGQLTRDGIAAAVNRASTKETPPAAATTTPARVTAMLSKDRAVTVSAPGLSSLDSLIEQLEEVLSKGKKARQQNIELRTWVRMLKDQAKVNAG